MSEHEVNLDNPFDMPEFDANDSDAVEHALAAVVATPEGRTLLWSIIGHTKIYDEGFAGNSGDIFDKGRRSVGLWLIAIMTEANPTTYPRMLLDVATREQRETKRLEQMEKDNERTG